MCYFFIFLYIWECMAVLPFYWVCTFSCLLTRRPIKCRILSLRDTHLLARQNKQGLWRIRSNRVLLGRTLFPDQIEKMSSLLSRKARCSIHISAYLSVIMLHWLLQCQYWHNQWSMKQGKMKKLLKTKSCLLLEEICLVLDTRLFLYFPPAQTCSYH